MITYKVLSIDNLHFPINLINNLGLFFSNVFVYNFKYDFLHVVDFCELVNICFNFNIESFHPKEFKYVHDAW